MNRTALHFDRPAVLSATAPPEQRGLARDEVRLMISTPDGHTHTRFRDLSHFLEAGDVLVVNQSATLPASLNAQGSLGSFMLNLSTDYGHGLWLAEPRWSSAEPGPLPLTSGEAISVAGMEARVVAPYPGLERLWFIQFEGDAHHVMACCGQPIRYGYVPQAYALHNYQTIFATIPGSAEMPSAARPFTARVLDSLRHAGVQMATITLHTGVSSLELETETVEDHLLYPEPFRVPDATAARVNAARATGHRVIAVGTTVVRALESAWDGEQVQPVAGFTRLYIHPQRGVNVVDGLVTGLHDPVTSHLAMLYAVAGQSLVRSAYEEAVRESYLWHEFGDSHLILARGGSAQPG